METKAQVTAVINQLAPVGSILAYYGPDQSQLAPGWLFCDGGTFDQNRYPALYQFLGKKTTVPDLRGLFLRGLDTSGKVDPDGAGRTIGDVQPNEVGSHDHSFWVPAYYRVDEKDGRNYFRGDTLTSGQTTSNTAAAGGKETRPVNAAVSYIIFAGLPQASDAAGGGG